MGRTKYTHLVAEDTTFAAAGGEAGEGRGFDDPMLQVGVGEVWDLLGSHSLGVDQPRSLFMGLHCQVCEIGGVAVRCPNPERKKEGKNFAHRRKLRMEVVRRKTCPPQPTAAPTLLMLT